MGEDLVREMVDKGNATLTPGSGRRIEWVCSVCHHRWTASVYNRAKLGSGCPECANSSRALSNIDLAVSDSHEGIATRPREMAELFDNAIMNDRTVLEGLELDIYLPDKSVAIEFNGLYWHSEKFKSPNYHYDKWHAATEAGIRLITIWEDQWRYDRQKVKNFLVESIFGRKNIGARKTKCVMVDYATAKSFLDKWHLQGSCSGSEYVGLTYNDELVAVAVFTRGERWSVDRYASSVGVQGGLDKMMHFAGHREWVTFADHSVSTGNLYSSSGWGSDGELRPDYMYVVKGRRVHKFNYRKARFETDPKLFFDPRMTERQLAAANGLLRVYDSGKTRYVRTL